MILLSTMQAVSVYLILYVGFFVMVTASTEQIAIKMPGVVTNKEDAYMCTHLHLKRNKYITRFEPNADMHIAHHMLLFKCSRPISHKKSYPCMMPCYGDRVVYAWARQAKGLKLPAGVSFEVGPSHGQSYLVLQVHYLKRIRKPDSSGVSIFTVPKPQPGIAGVMLMTSDMAAIPGRTKDVRLYFACRFPSRTTIYPFAFRTHAHTLARTIFADHFSPDGSPKATLLGRASPQWPQAFYNTASTAPIGKGDAIVGACVYDSTKRRRKTMIGATHNDEMCNFYLMYYRKREDRALTMDEGEVCGDGVVLGRKLFNGLRQLIPASTFDHLPTTFSDSALRDALHVEQPFNYEHLKWMLKDRDVGQISGVSMDSSGHLILFHRGDRVWDDSTFDRHHVLKESYRREPIKQATILVVDVHSRTVVSEFGKDMFYLPHGITVDSEDNLWLTDVGTHQVYKLAKDDKTKFGLVLGVKFQPGSDRRHFCKPTDVAVLNNGSFFVADGYCNSRILKFSEKREIVSVIRSSEGDFDVPHSLTLAGQDRVCVADRERARIECFSSRTGKPLFTLKNNPAFGDAIYAITMDPRDRNDTIHGVVRRPRGPKGFTLSLKSQKVLSQWGSELKLPHDIASSSSYLFVADIAKPFRLVAFKDASADSGNASEETSSMSLNVKSMLANNGTIYRSEGFMNLLSENAPFLVGVIIVLPLAIIVLGAVIVHLHRNGMCPCFCRQRRPGIRSDYKRGRFEPLLNDKDDSDSEDNEELYNIESVKKRYELKT